MGRELRRVPLDYEGLNDPRTKFADDADMTPTPPEGEAYQLWETTSAGNPISPPFATLEELCEYAESNCSAFADHMLTKEEWLRQLSERGWTMVPIARNVWAL
jgi:hypothetical protein